MNQVQAAMAAARWTAGTRPNRMTGKDKARRLKAVERRDGNRCWVCKRDFGADDVRSLDHVIPWSQGGTNAIENLRLAHKICNEYRANRSPILRERLKRGDFNNGERWRPPLAA